MPVAIIVPTMKMPQMIRIPVRVKKKHIYQARSQHEADKPIASSVFSKRLFFVTENYLIFWGIRHFGLATGPRLVWFSTLATGLFSNILLPLIILGIPMDIWNKEPSEHIEHSEYRTFDFANRTFGTESIRNIDWEHNVRHNYGGPRGAWHIYLELLLFGLGLHFIMPLIPITFAW